MTTYNSLPRRSIAITFDDGWLDNYTYAYPILKKYQVPATIFAVSGMIGTNRSFWPNRLARLLHEQSASADWHSGLQWLADLTPLKPPDLKSSEILSQVIDACKHLPDSVIQQHLDKVETANTEEKASRTMLNWQEMREMRESGLVDFGCHTENHVRLLDDLPANVLHSEVLSCKLQLEQGTGQSPSLFCYPNGDISKLAEELVSSNYRAAVSTEKGINRQHENMYKLKRIGMHEDVSSSRSAFMARLSGLI